MIDLMKIVELGGDLQIAIGSMDRQEILRQIQDFNHNGVKLDFTSKFLAQMNEGQLSHILYGAWCLIEVKLISGKELVVVG